MVRPREPHHFEGEDLCAEVPHIPERDEQIDLPEWSASIPGTTPWNGAVDGLSADRGMPISLSVDASSTLIPLSPSIMTLWILLDLNRGATTSG
jgi:hypothetical protein